MLVFRDFHGYRSLDKKGLAVSMSYKPNPGAEYPTYRRGESNNERSRLVLRAHLGTAVYIVYDTVHILHFNYTVMYTHTHTRQVVV